MKRDASYPIDTTTDDIEGSAEQKRKNDEELGFLKN